MALLEVNGIGKSFGTTKVLRDISFELAEGEALAMPGSAPTGEAVSLTLTVDGTAVSQPAVLVNGNYYLAEGFLAQLGAESALVEGVLAITAA